MITESTMKTIFLLFALVLMMSVVQGMHMHPRSLVRLGEIEVEGDNKSENMVSEVDGVPIDVIRNIRPNRFVPINSALFFKTFPPCEEGLKRDMLGICREVWD